MRRSVVLSLPLKLVFPGCFNAFCCYSERHDSECNNVIVISLRVMILSAIMLIVIFQSVIMLTVILLSVIMLSAVNANCRYS